MPSGALKCVSVGTVCPRCVSSTKIKQKKVDLSLPLFFFFATLQGMLQKNKNVKSMCVKQCKTAKKANQNSNMVYQLCEFINTCIFNKHELFLIVPF